jgi:maleylpyruvate isomerase
LAARSGSIVRRYVSPAARNADVDLGATRPPQMIVDDFLLRCRHFLIEVEAATPEMWTTAMVSPLYHDEGPPRELSTVLVGRTSEIEIHHTDLGTKYTFANTPPDMRHEFLDRYAASQTADGMTPCRCIATDSGATWAVGSGEGPTVRGSEPDLLRWLAGREGGDGLSVDGGEALPELAPVIPPT